jgi:putative ABC transport system permease protein
MATMPELLRGRLVGPRFNLLLIGVFALLALLLSAAGVYALVAYTVTMRTREFGIRLALGARASQVLLAVMLDTGRLLAAGLVIGGLGALFFTRLLRGFIQDVAPTDASAVAFAVVLLGVAAVAAAAGPALRAARTQPATVLRAE